MDDFVIIGEQGGHAFVESPLPVKAIEPIVLRFYLSPVQNHMSLILLNLPAEWQRTPPQIFWIKRFNWRCGCLLDDSCVEPHQCYQKMWS